MIYTWAKPWAREALEVFTLEHNYPQVIRSQLKSFRKIAVSLTSILVDKDQYLKAALHNEIEIIQKLHSDNIVGFYDVMESSKSYYLIQ